MKNATISLILLFCASLAIAGGSSEMSSADRGKSVAESGRVIPPEEIRVDSYVSQIDFHYPDPAGDLGVSLLSGHRQVSAHGQDELLQVGIQGRRGPFDEVPSLNLAFVLDASGSMSAAGKVEFAKTGFALLLRRLRPQDTLSVITVTDTARLLLPASQVRNVDREPLIRTVSEVLPAGTTALLAGLEAGREQVLRAYYRGGVNRIIFVSDGLGSSAGVQELAARCRTEGVSITAIGVGLDMNLPLMSDLAKNGGGSARFLSDEKKITEVFDTDLARTVVPVAYDLAIRLECAEGVRILETWGYDHFVTGGRATFSLPTLHHGDYETIMVRVRVPPGLPIGPMELARVSVSCNDPGGRPRPEVTGGVRLEIADLTPASGGISDPLVLKAGTILHAAIGLSEIGTLYQSLTADNAASAALSAMSWQNRDVDQTVATDTLVARERGETVKSMTIKRQRCLDLSVALRTEVTNAHLRLGEEPFANVLDILAQYVKKLGKELGLSDGVVAAHLADRDILPPEDAGSLRGRVASLMRELVMAVGDRPSVVLFAGFTPVAGEASALQGIADEIARSTLAGSGCAVVPPSRLSAYLAARGAQARGLVDTDATLEAAAALGADYAFGGSIIELPTSVVLFGRLLARAGGSVVSVAQLVLPLDDEVRSLLGSGGD